ncbi:hypothetical protein ES702_05093 [subsurface metagenome]
MLDLDWTGVVSHGYNTDIEKKFIALRRPKYVGQKGISFAQLAGYNFAKGGVQRHENCGW